jgi:type IV pilus assembly protein PilE
MKHDKHAGFTLVELLATLAIAALLLSLALPGYRQQVLRANRSVAWLSLQRLAARQEAYYLREGQYAATLEALHGAAPQDPAPSRGDNLYTISLVSRGEGTAWTLHATAVGSQQSDRLCATLSVDQLGRKTATTVAGDPAEGCW